MAPAATADAGHLMEQAFKCVAAQDLDALAACWHDDIIEEFLVTGALHGKTDVREYFTELWAATDDWNFEVERILPVDDRISVGAWRLRAIFTGGPFQGIEATDRPVDIRGLDVMEFEDGLLVHNTIYYDGMAWARQAGLLPGEGSMTDKAMLGALNAVTKARRLLTRG